MDAFIESLASADIMKLATHPLAIIGACVLLALAVLFRWKMIMLMIFAVGGTLAVLRYSHMGSSPDPGTSDLGIFAGGTVLVAFIIIYFLFIKGD
jgi:hypothetical protein